MPEPFLEELDRASHKSAVNPDKEYVQWQRGPLTATTMATMKAWVDTTLSENNIWLVLVFHGVDGIGWQAKTGAELRTYYEYIKSKEDNLWIATFGDVAKYMRERMNSQLKSENDENGISISLVSNLDSMYDIPLTLKTYINRSADKLTIKQGDKNLEFKKGEDEKGTFILYHASPNAEPVKISLN